MHSTSFASSHDQSTDSIGSVQRSNLAMTVGDTKSIVLALQALQEKIRKLEQDRNFHQEQCEKAQTAHEAFKLEIEQQLDTERTQHRHREQELQDLLARANAERSRLQATLEESKSDIGHFRVELEQLLQSERDQARHREDALRDELDQLRSSLATEKRECESLTASLEQLKAEKEIINTTNRRLESTIRDLIAVNNNLMDSVKRGGAAAVNSGARQTTVARHRGVSASRHADPMGSHNTSTSGFVAKSTTTRPASHRTSAPSSARFTYMNPTHASAVRDVRYGEVSARSGTPQRPPSPARVPLGRASSRGRTGALNNSGIIQPDQIRAMDEVYDELQGELKSLEEKYRDAVHDAARHDTNPETLNATLNSIMGQIQRKSEQVRLMRQTKQELASVSGGLTVESSGGAVAKGVEKALQRSQIVSELRALFAKPTY